MARRRVGGRSRRSYLADLVFVLALFAAVYAFLSYGGPSWFGQLAADLFGMP